ncbi:MAG: rubrerythrin [Lentisphaeria bacterium]|nr:rubrerythrin [Lentisphaeria bacterium]
MLAQGEAKGAMMYYALANLAREQGMDDAAAKFVEAANQEANHAGFYAMLSGMYPREFWPLVRGLAKAEAAGEGSLKKLAERFRAAGLDAAVPELEVFAAQEAHHGVMMRELIDKYHQNIDTAGKRVYVCGVCGYEYVGDLDAEPEDFVCPVCGQSKKVFRESK